MNLEKDLEARPGAGRVVGGREELPLVSLPAEALDGPAACSTTDCSRVPPEQRLTLSSIAGVAGETHQ